MEQVSERAMRIAEEITRRTMTEHYRLVLNEERQPGTTDSKIGGKPYWPAGKDYPVDHNGKPMLMVMQVNCAQSGLRSPLPERGMLQWFIGLDDERMYGCRGNYDDNGEGFSVVYHDNIDECAVPSGIPTHDSVDESLTPVKRELAIDVLLEQTAMGVNDGHFNDLFFEVVKDLTGEEHSGMMWYQYLDNEEGLYLERNQGMARPHHQMLGYPVYSQEEARRDISFHDTLLFQLDSQFSPIDREELVMWGDMGSGFVFINHDDLARRDFGRAYYCWDCG